MDRPSVIPGIKVRLEEWLDLKESQYLSQPKDLRQPTLPVTADGSPRPSTARGCGLSQGCIGSIEPPGIALCIFQSKPSTHSD